MKESLHFQRKTSFLKQHTGSHRCCGQAEGLTTKIIEYLSSTILLLEISIQIFMYNVSVNVAFPERKGIRFAHAFV